MTQDIIDSGLNTNEKYDPSATDYNKQKKEVVIYGGLKDSISKLKQGDGVFLY